MDGRIMETYKPLNSLFLHFHIKDKLSLNILGPHLEAVFEFVQHARELLVPICARVKAWVTW